MLIIAVLITAAGCQHSRSRGTADAAGPGLRMGSAPIPRLPVPEVNLALKPPDLRLDLNWLELDSFFPPGVHRVGPTQPLAAELAPVERVRFPSTELCPSPNGCYVLFHDGMKRKNRDIQHWLLLLRNEPNAYPNTIFGTTLAFEAAWAEDSSRFAVTHFTGDNASEVFVVGVNELERRPIDVRPFIEAYYPPHLAPLPMFVKAYRWTRDGRLIVRAIARAREEPYELYGCEVAVNFSGGAEPRTTFLRGYVGQDSGPK